MPNIAYILPELVALFRTYEKIDDCCKGGWHIKWKRHHYLPFLQSTGDKDDDDKRYEAYLQRAIFYNVVQGTVEGLVGQVFQHEPLIEVPNAMDAVIEDAQGDGITIQQLAKRAVRHVVKYARSGIFIDYPETNTPASVADQQDGFLRATIIVYPPEQIINWRKITIGARKLLSLVVIHDQQVKYDDGFQVTYEQIYRVLRLQAVTVAVEDNLAKPGSGFKYVQELWRVGDEVPFKTMDILGGDGKPLDEIPFMFIGAQTNDAEVVVPDMAALADLNIGHYCNSADYEDSVHLVGQPQPYYTGITDDWIAKQEGKMYFGSRAPWLLPPSATAGLLQVSPNTMPKEAMTMKEAQMLAIGAKLITPQRVQRTATEATIDSVTELSALQSISGNVSAAFEFALKKCALFMNLPQDDIKFELTKDFDAANMKADERKQLLTEWMSGGLTWGEYRAQLRRAGVATEDDEEAKASIEADMPPPVVPPDPNADPNANPDPNAQPPALRQAA